MITSLKNNGNLLNGRKRGFFKRELSYAEIRKYYKESTDPISKEKGSNPIELKEIRERLTKIRRRYAYLQALLYTLVLLLIGFGAYSFLNNKVGAFQKHEKGVVEVPYYIQKNVFDQSIYKADEFLKRKEYFFAIGYYKRALKVKPENIKAEFGLAKSYSRACKYQSIFCTEAIELIQQMEEKYPNQVSFTKLKKIYLTVNTE